MPGCTRLTAGIPNPLPASPIFLYLDKDGRPVPPPNYVPSLDDCHDSGCSCGCSDGAAAGMPSGGGCGCGGSSSGCASDAHAGQIQAVNAILQQASQDFSRSPLPGWLEVWDGSSGNFLRQFSVPTVDALGPTPVFTYNSSTALSTAGSPFGAGWSMIFNQTVQAVSSTTAIINKGTGASLTYTSKNATTGVYAAPAEALNKLVQNADSSWTETQPDGLALHYSSAGRLASIKRAASTWTSPMARPFLAVRIPTPSSIRPVAVRRFSLLRQASATRPTSCAATPTPSAESPPSTTKARSLAFNWLRSSPPT